MNELNDNEMELWLSKYFDGELTPAELAAVEAKLQHDARWRTEYQRLERSTRHIERVLVKYNQDNSFSRDVIARLKAPKAARAHAAPRHARSIRRIHRRSASWAPLGLAAAVVLCVAGVVTWNVLHTPPSNVSRNTSPPGVFQISAPVEVLEWPDGTRIAARQGTVVTRVDDRTVKLSGHALFLVARNDKPFTILTPDGRKVQALGTRFDVTTVQDGARVRVTEGHVRIETRDARKVDARGGVLVQPSLETRMFDPREVSADWHSAGLGLDSIAPWPQTYGSAANSGATPLRGPKALNTSPEHFFAFPKQLDAPLSGALVSAQQMAYVVLRNQGDAVLAELDIDGTNRGAWRICNTPHVSLRIAPVITPKGYVVTAALDGTIAAYDPATDRVAWTYKESAMLTGLCTDPRGTLLVSTIGSVLALDSNSGKALWENTNLKNVSAPVTVLNSGRLCVVQDNTGVTVLEGSTGRTLQSHAWPRNTVRPAAVATPEPGAPKNSAREEVWLTSSDGYIARLSLDDGKYTEKYYGWQLRCGPLASGLLGHGSMVQHFDQSAQITAPASENISSLAQDGRAEIFAGYSRSVIHIQNATPAAELATWKGVIYGVVHKGDIVRNGLAIAGGTLVVTTSHGIQLFE